MTQSVKGMEGRRVEERGLAVNGCEREREAGTKCERERAEKMQRADFPPAE